MLPAVDYDYKIVGAEENLKVVYESVNRRDAEEMRDRLQIRGCEVYAEVGGVLYRVICPQTKVESEYK